MKEELRIYTKGSASRGDEIIMFLEDLGGRNSNALHGYDIDAYYFINPKGIISKIYPTDDTGVFTYIKEFYKEIGIPRWKPKYKGFFYYFNVLGKVLRNTWYDDDDENSAYEFGNCFNTYDKAKAAKDKIKEILNPPTKWKPKYKEYYYYVDKTGNVLRNKWFDFQIEDSCFEFDNRFKTQEEAEAARDKIKEILNK